VPPLDVPPPGAPLLDVPPLDVLPPGALLPDALPPGALLPDVPPLGALPLDALALPVGARSPDAPDTYAQTWWEASHRFLRAASMNASASSSAAAGFA
jgi:hypothetical protein